MSYSMISDIVATSLLYAESTSAVGDVQNNNTFVILAIVIICVMIFISLIKNRINENKNAKAQNEAFINERMIALTSASYDPYSYETACAMSLEKDGYSCDVTPKSGDYGADIIATDKKTGRKVAIQCKLYSVGHKVGIKAVQEVVSAKTYYQCDEAWVMTNSSYTNAAQEFAMKTGAELKVYQVNATQIINSADDFVENKNWGANKRVRFKESQTWNTPSGDYWDLCHSLLEEQSLIIVGDNSSDNSSFLHSTIYTALIHSPVKVCFALIDLNDGKELSRYSTLPHTIGSAFTPKNVIPLINQVEKVAYDKNSFTSINGIDLYVIVDELELVAQKVGTEAVSLLLNLLQKKRQKTNIHVILATRNPYCVGLERIKHSQFSSVLLLKCTDYEVSEKLLDGISDASELEEHEQGYLLVKGNPFAELVAIPRTEEDKINGRIKYWLKAKPF